jgi:hypothetical protein
VDTVLVKMESDSFHAVVPPVIQPIPMVSVTNMLMNVEERMINRAEITGRANVYKDMSHITFANVMKGTNPNVDNQTSARTLMNVRKAHIIVDNMEPAKIKMGPMNAIVSQDIEITSIQNTVDPDVNRFLQIV